MQCPNCNNTVPDTANVCGYCGTRLRVPAPIHATPQPSQQFAAAPPTVQPAPRRSRIPAWLWVVAIFFCLVITVILVWALLFSDINIVLGSDQTIPPTVVIQQPQEQVATISALKQGIASMEAYLELVEGNAVLQ
ncbi:MAG: zinc-ribbon domain-containing protein [Chloroflexi bacterium]|nr:zinc-ribbon domain-containing protein [Chloroflexota bacterium]